MGSAVLSHFSKNIPMKMKQFRLKGGSSEHPLDLSLKMISYCVQIQYFSTVSDFLGLIWGWILAPFQIKNMQKLPKMVYIIPSFLVLHFGENFMKIRTKIAKLQMHENLHKIVNENMFSFTFLCRFS